MQSIRAIDGLHHLDLTRSEVGITVRPVRSGSARGRFTQAAGRVVLDASQAARSALLVAVAASSFDSGDVERDERLRGAGQLDARHHPVITFVGVGFELLDEQRARVAGELTLKGSTRPLVVELEHTSTSIDPTGVERIGLEGHARISRRDLDLAPAAAPQGDGRRADEEIHVEFHLSATRQDVVVTDPDRMAAAIAAELHVPLDAPVEQAVLALTRRSVAGQGNALSAGARPRRGIVEADEQVAVRPRRSAEPAAEARQPVAPQVVAGQQPAAQQPTTPTSGVQKPTTGKPSEQPRQRRGWRRFFGRN